MLNILFWSWCLPQTLLGFIIKSFYKLTDKIAKVITYKSARVVFIKNWKFTGVSLGKYIILNESEDGNINTFKHEYGHTIQSFILGITYLFVVGIPSVIRNIKCQAKSLPYEEYYKKYPENWADKLGGVTR